MVGRDKHSHGWQHTAFPRGANGLLEAFIKHLWVSMRRSTAWPISLQAPPSHLSHVFRVRHLNKCSIEGKEKDQAGNTCGQQASYTTTSFKSP